LRVVSEKKNSIAEYPLLRDRVEEIVQIFHIPAEYYPFRSLNNSMYKIALLFSPFDRICCPYLDSGHFPFQNLSFFSFTDPLYIFPRLFSCGASFQDPFAGDGHEAVPESSPFVPIPIRWSAGRGM